MASNGRNSRDNSRAGFEKRQKRRQIRALQEAIDNRDSEGVKVILEDEFDVDFQYRSQTALQLAVREGCLGICKMLIDRGANVNMADAEQNNLLNMACYRGYTDIAELLVQKGAEIDTQNIHGSSPLHVCAVKGQSDILQVLISANADLDSVNQQWETALHVAVNQQNTEAIQLLVLGGCKVDKADENRRTPLMLAAERGFSDVVILLLNGGASVNAQDKTGATALYEAVKNGHLNVVQTLVEMGADINLPLTRGTSPLLESIHVDHTDIALYLIDANCNVNLTDRLKQAPIHSAVSKVSQFFSEEVEQAILLVKKLVEAGCELNLANQQGERPLYQSACGGNLELTEYLLGSGVDLAVKTDSGDTILHGAVHGNRPKIVDKLIEAGCLLNEKNLAGEHALLTAVIYRADFEIVKSLVHAGSNLDIKDKTGANTPLHNAILHYYSEAALLLIENGCDVNVLNGKRISPLYMACEKNDEAAALKILDSPKFSKKLFTVLSIPQPLFAAVANNHVNLVDTLIHAGCDINMINIEGQSPVMHAIQENCPFVVKFLLKYNCDLEAHAKVSRLFKCCLLQDDHHPHFALHPLFLALTHKSVAILQLLINCYWHVPIKIVQMLDQVFKSTPNLNSHYSPELKEEIHALFRYTVKTPRTLQETCRAEIREKLGSLPQEKVERLPIAKKLYAYVLMDEYFGDLSEKIRQNEKAHPTDFHGFQSRAAALQQAELQDSE